MCIQLHCAFVSYSLIFSNLYRSMVNTKKCQFKKESQIPFPEHLDQVIQTTTTSFLIPWQKPCVYWPLDVDLTAT